MVVTSIENVLDFICDFNAVVGAHKHPVNEKVGQFGSQTFGVENRSRGFPSVVVPRLFFLLLLSFQLFFIRHLLELATATFFINLTCRFILCLFSVFLFLILYLTLLPGLPSAFSCISHGCCGSILLWTVG